MNSVTKCVASAGGVVLAAVSIVGGSYAREHVDLGSKAAEVAQVDLPLHGMLASQDDGIQVPEGDYFYELTKLLKREYVEPITNDQKLASGAIRGMVGSLGDPKSLFYDKTQFKTFLSERQGRYEGIGADLALVSGRPPKPASDGEGDSSEDTPEEVLATSQSIPRLTVVGLVPGGPAEKAGVQLGDKVYSVDGHWLVNSDLMIRFRQAQKDFQAKKITLDSLNTLRKELKEKSDHAVLPLRARDKLLAGITGSVSVVWERDGVKRTTDIQKAASSKPEFSSHDGTIVLPFTDDSPEQLRKAIEGQKKITIDLRTDTLGDSESMRRCLAVVAPAGTYGAVLNDRHEKVAPLVIGKGNPNPPQMKLLVSAATRGPAEVFALALSSKRLAELSGHDTGGDRSVIEIVSLPDGSGYTLRTGEYSPTATKQVVALRGGSK